MTRDVIAVGASAGGVEALSRVVAGLPSDLPAAVFVVLHVSPTGTSVLPDLLTRAGPLQAHHAEDNEPIRHGQIYVAPPDRHLLIENDRVRVVRGPTENGHRPSVDVLFRSAARYGGERAVGVVLSGLLDDGTSGLAAIKRRGGLSIVQDPADAIFRGMPQSAIDNVEIDHIQPVSEIGTLLATVARTPIKRTDKKENSVSLSELNRDLATACMEPDALDAGGHPGAPSPYSCPDCGGVLWEIPEGETFRFRCRTGHAYSSRILLTKQSVALDEALWTALRALEESGDLAARLSARAQQRGHAISADRFAHQAASARERAEIVRQVLLRPDPELMDETRR